MEKDQAFILTKKAFVGGSHLVITKSWVSNGFWGVKKCCLLNAADFQNVTTAKAFLEKNGLARDYTKVEERKDSDIKKLLLANIPDAKKYERTDYLKDTTKTAARIFHNHVFSTAFDDRYVKALNVSILFGFGVIFQNASKAKDTTIIMAPLKMDKAEKISFVYDK
jgi:hypothetical protein